MLIIPRDQETYPFLNMCNLCRYAWFTQAQSHLLANDGDPYYPPTLAGVLHIIFLKLRQGIINFYQFCAVKKLKAQCKEQEVPMQFILYPVTSNSHKECYYA